MSLRDRWIIGGLAVLVAALIGLAFWQQVRFSEADRATREYALLEERLDGQDEKKGDPLAKEARQEVRRSLTKGEFHAAMSRLQALTEEQERPAEQRPRGAGLPLDRLWPEGSPERDRARATLRLLAQKQQQGFEMSPARDALLRVADAARRGMRKEALAAFGEVEAGIRNAELRPGFRPAQAARARGGLGGPGGAAAGGALTPQEFAAIRQVARFLSAELPMMIDNAQTPEQRSFLLRVQSFGRDFMTAVRARKDVRPTIQLLSQLGPAVAEQRQDDASKLLTQAWDLLRAAKPLPPQAFAAAPVRIPFRPGVGAGAPAPGVPKLPAVPGAGGAPARPGGLPGITAEQLQFALDAVRAMPEAKYQEERPRIAARLAKLLASMATRSAPPALQAQVPPAPRPADPEVVTDTGLRLSFQSRGQIRGLFAGRRSLTSERAASGLFLRVGKATLPITGPMEREGTGWRLRAGAPAGRVTADYTAEGALVRIRLLLDRVQEGEAAQVVFRLPIQAGGWRWKSGAGEPQVIAIDGRYLTEAGTEPVVLDGGAVSLAVAAPGGTVSYVPEPGYLEVALPLPAASGKTEHTITLTSPRPGGA